MLGFILVTRGTHSGKDVILGFPNSIFKQNLSYFDSVHYNTTISNSNSSKTFILGWPVSVIAELLCPKKERWDKILDFSAESIRFIGYPASVIYKSKSKPGKILSSHSLNSIDSDASSRFKENIAAFNVVLVFEVDSPLLKNSEKIKEAVIAISNKKSDQTLKFEEKRSGYLSNEVLKLKNIRDSCQNKDEEIQTMLNESSLAKELIHIYTDLSIKGETFIEINGWLKLNLLITPTETCFTCSEYQSLLFYDNPKRLEPLINEKSQTTLLVSLLKKCKYPSTPFKDIAESEGVTFKAVSNAALHFVRWNKAKIVACFNDESLFVNSSTFCMSKELALEYDKIFKSKQFEVNKSIESYKIIDLNKLLFFFSSPKSIKSMEKLLIPKAKTIPLVTWLMRKEIIQSVHYYLYLIHKSPEEILSSSPSISESLTLQKLLPYLNMQSPLEEILSHTHLTFPEIITCSKRFASHIKLVIH